MDQYVLKFPNGTAKSFSSDPDQMDPVAVARDNLLTLNIYFGSKTVTEVKEQETYPSVSKCDTYTYLHFTHFAPVCLIFS